MRDSLYLSEDFLIFSASADRCLYGPQIKQVSSFTKLSRNAESYFKKDKKRRSNLGSRRASRFSIGSAGNAKPGDRSFVSSLLGTLAKRKDSANGLENRSVSKFKPFNKPIFEMEEDNTASRMSFGDTITRFMTRLDKKPSSSVLRSPSRQSNRSVSETVSRIERDLSITKLEESLKKVDRYRSETPNKQEELPIKKDTLDCNQLFPKKIHLISLSIDKYSPLRNRFLGISKNTNIPKIVNFRKRQFNYFHNQAIASLNRAITDSQEGKCILYALI